jgi:hypothetical protein
MGEECLEKSTYFFVFSKVGQRLLIKAQAQLRGRVGRI